MPDRLRVEINGDAALIVIKGSIGPELAVTVPVSDLHNMERALRRAREEAWWQRAMAFRYGEMANADS